jgi:hypothetical protein
MDAYFYIYLASILVAFIIGAVVQTKFTAKKSDDEYNKI